MTNKFKKHLAYFKVFATGRVASDTAVLYVSSMVASGVGFLSSVFVARSLGPDNFALIAGYNAIVLTLAGFTDFGLGTGLIRFTSAHKNGDKAKPYYRFVFLAEIVIASVLLLVGLLFSHRISGLVGQSLPLRTVQIAIFSGAITSVAAYVGAALAAHKKFKTNAVISITTSVLKLLFVGMLLVTHTITVPNIIIGYVVLSVFNAAFGFLLAPKDYLEPVDKKEVWKAGKNVIKFSGWLTISFFITSITGKLDFFYLYKIKGAAEAGVYAAAQQLSIVYSIFLGAISTVATPYVSEKVSHKDKVQFLKRSLPLAFGVGVLFIASGLLAPEVIRIIFGAKYASAIVPLQILVVHLAINVFMIPISLLFIPLGKVMVGTFITAAQLGLALLLYPLLITKYGAPGAAATVLASTVLGLLIYSIALTYYLLREKNKPSAKPEF